MLGVATSFILLLFFLGANWTTVFLGIKERYQGADPADVIGFSNLDGIVNSMIVLVAAALLLFLFVAIAAARRVAKVPTIRLVSDKQKPELTLGKGLKWHLFVSHVWCAAKEGGGSTRYHSLTQELPTGLPVKTRPPSSRETYSNCCQASKYFSMCARCSI